VRERIDDADVRVVGAMRRRVVEHEDHIAVERELFMQREPAAIAVAPLVRV
jgi:hypothetical protein